MGYQYKTIPGPEKAKKFKGTKSRAERMARTFEEILNEAAEDGWEYLRTDIVSIEERPGFFSRAREVNRTMMIFRKALAEPVAEPLENERPTQRLFRQQSSEPEVAPAERATAPELPPLPKEYDDLSADPIATPDRLAR